MRPVLTLVTLAHTKGTNVLGCVTTYSLVLLCVVAFRNVIGSIEYTKKYPTGVVPNRVYQTESPKLIQTSDSALR